jgi:hypothetical protein
MRPEDVLAKPEAEGPSVAVPIDLELEALDSELDTAGDRARRTLNGQRQATRYFALALRTELLEAFRSLEAGPVTPR